MVSISMLSNSGCKFIKTSRAGALLAPHPDTGFVDLQETTLKVWQDLADNTPEAGVKVGLQL